MIQFKLPEFTKEEPLINKSKLSKEDKLDQANNEVALGHVYVMTHSFFSDVIRIGCTPDDPNNYAHSLSAQSPGTYNLIFSLKCEKPCQVKSKIRQYLNAQKYVNEFYQVPPEVAKTLLTRETFRIPTLDLIESN